jgi:hypothetical protein
MRSIMHRLEQSSARMNNGYRQALRVERGRNSAVKDPSKCLRDERIAIVDDVPRSWMTHRQ